MGALVFDGTLRFDSSVVHPSRANDQVLLRIRRAGICNTDLEIVKGYMGFKGILGHEFVGEVVESSNPHWLGKRVVGEINVACGHCDLCHRGIPSQCRNRTTVGIDRHPGAFADMLALTERNLHLIPDTVNDDAAVFIEPLAAALQTLENVQISPHQRIVLIGAGKLGLLIAQVLKLVGADLTVVARREKPARLLAKWGIRTAALNELPQKTAHIVVDATGNAEGFASALTLVEPRGIILLKSTYQGIPQIDMTRIVVDEIRVVGSRCGPFDAAIRLLDAGLIDTASMIEARYRLSDALTAFEHAARPGALKVILEV